MQEIQRRISIAVDVIESEDPRVQYVELNGIRLIIEDGELTGWYRPELEPVELETVELKDWNMLNTYHAQCPNCGSVRNISENDWSYCPACGNKTTGVIRVH